MVGGGVWGGTAQLGVEGGNGKAAGAGETLALGSRLSGRGRAHVEIQSLSGPCRLLPRADSREPMRTVACCSSWACSSHPPESREPRAVSREPRATAHSRLQLGLQLARPRLLPSLELGQPFVRAVWQGRYCTLRLPQLDLGRTRPLHLPPRTGWWEAGRGQVLECARAGVTRMCVPAS